MAEIIATEADGTRPADIDMGKMQAYYETTFGMDRAESKAHAMRELEGNRYKVNEFPGFFLVLDGMTRHIEDPEVYRAMFGEDTGQGVQEISLDDFFTMPRGPAITANPPLISPPEDGPVWLIDEGRKRWVLDPGTMMFYGFKFEGVVRNNGKGYPEGEPVRRDYGKTWED